MFNTLIFSFHNYFRIIPSISIEVISNMITITFSIKRQIIKL